MADAIEGCANDQWKPGVLGTGAASPWTHMDQRRLPVPGLQRRCGVFPVYLPGRQGLWSVRLNATAALGHEHAATGPGS
jgi:hypothetical protein